MSKETLRRILVSHFSEGELQDLCFDLGIDFEDLSAKTKKDAGRELLILVERQGRIEELIRKAFHLRPNAPWPVSVRQSITTFDLQNSKIGNKISNTTVRDPFSDLCRRLKLKLSKQTREHLEDDTDFRIALEAIAHVAPMIRSRYGERLTEVLDRDRREIVTSTDEWAADEIRRILLTQNHEYAFLCEEFHRHMTLSGRREMIGPNRKCWVVDPLDATSAFVHKANQAYPSIMIALAESTKVNPIGQYAIKVMLGIIFFPMTSELFYAFFQKGAYCNGKRLVMGNVIPHLSTCWVSMNHYSDIQLETSLFKSIRDGLRSPKGAQLVSIDVPHSGIAVRVIDRATRLAAVVHDNNPIYPKQQVWDVCAPQIIVSEANGVFLNSSGKEYAPFEDCDLIVVAQNSQIAEDILSLSKYST
jgi:fructose-1,6-bisphosphatase/inositol monophosphatase family enzyme